MRGPYIYNRVPPLYKIRGYLVMAIDYGGRLVQMNSPPS